MAKTILYVPGPVDLMGHGRRITHAHNRSRYRFRPVMGRCVVTGHLCARTLLPSCTRTSLMLQRTSEYCSHAGNITPPLLAGSVRPRGSKPKLGMGRRKGDRQNWAIRTNRHIAESADHKIVYVLSGQAAVEVAQLGLAGKGGEGHALLGALALSGAYGIQ